MSFIKKEPSSQYGLILPKKNQLSAPRAGNVFGDDNISDEEEGVDLVKKTLKAHNEKNRVKRQTKLDMQKALKEDATIYQYDEVYEDLQKVKEESKSSKTVEKKAKYIGNLLKAAERRKREQEFRLERQVQKERDEEGEKFADKECLITSAYRAKLEELKKLKEEDERMDRLEAIADVTKQKDISGFYRHLYRQTVESKEKDIKQEDPDKNNDKQEDPKESSSIDKDHSPSTSESETSETFNEKHSKSSKLSAPGKSSKARQYRKRAMEASESESEEEVKEDTSERRTPVQEEKPKEVSPKRNKLSEEKPSVEKSDIKSEDENSKPKPEVKLSTESGTSKETSATESEVFVKPEVKPQKKRVDIWKKRTVGPVFDAALQRYLERKANRFSGLQANA